jgi:hypothetical protein
MPKELLHVVPVEKLLQYNVSVQEYDRSQSVPKEPLCNGFIVRNVGTSGMTINGDALATGESKTVGGNRGEVYVGRIDISFDNAGTNLCIVTQKFYLNIPMTDQQSI